MIRHRRRLLAPLLVVALLRPQPLDAQRPGAIARSAATATRHGFSVARLARLDSALQEAVGRGELAGVVALVLRDGRPVYERAVGWADREAGRRMTPDAIFRVASQTKALTSVAIMMLVEEGRIALADPVGRHLPAFARTSVAVRSDTGMAVVPARRAITIRDLLTHTAGISYGVDSLVAARYARHGFGPAAGYGWYLADRDEEVCAAMDRLATLPFVAHPGERYVYGYATDVLGCVVERVSGMSLAAFLERRITGPLGMRDTHFFLPRGKEERLAAVYASTDSGTVRAPDGARGQGHYVTGPRRLFSGGAGLLSTARDYARFLELLRRGGEIDGVRLLAPATVSLMVANHVDTLYHPIRRGEGFGLGFSTVEDRGAAARVESEGTWGWGGAYGSNYLVDPVEGLTILILTQQLPDRSVLRPRFAALVYQALVEPRRR